MKIIFLDIDGVLNNQFSKSRCGQFIGIDNDKVKLLRKIVDATGAKIVLSSTWRLGYNRAGYCLDKNHKYMNNKLRKQELRIYSVTPNLHGDCRGAEINQWLKEHKHENIENWVVLDDEFFPDFNAYDIPQHLVETFFYSEYGGLTEEHVEKAIDILNS